MSKTSITGETPIENKQKSAQGNKTKHHPDVHYMLSDTLDSTESIVSMLSDQETRDPLNEENCTNAGKHEFAIYKTSLPQIRSWKDLEEGMLIYRPTTNPYAVFEIIDPTPVDDEHFDKIKVRRHSRSDNGSNPTYRSQVTLLFQQQITQQMTYLQDPHPQSNLTEY